MPDDSAANSKTAAPFFERRAGRILLYSSLGTFAAFLVLFGAFYLHYAHIINEQLAAGTFAGTVDIYTAPRVVAVGDPLTPADLIAYLRRRGYTTSYRNTSGWYEIRHDAIAIFPGDNDFAGGEPGVLHFARGRISRIVSLADNTERQEFSLDPQLIANLSPNREKRRLVRYAEIPTALVNAVVSAEDKHFFHHSGFDGFRALKAAWVDLKTGRKQQGASTLTMQLARSIWLDPEKHFSRKLRESLITMHLEFRLSKQQIFEDYANQVYLGRAGTFTIRGFGEAARTYFGKDISQLTIPEAALLAGMIQRPSYFNPYRYPDRARDRRDVVLALMRDNGYLTAGQYQEAAATPLRVAPPRSESTAMQYFVDVMNDQLQAALGENEPLARSIYTTVDPDLQEAAQEAVNKGMALIDANFRGRRDIPAQQPQVALIALDPHTGEIKALVGGRNYAASQLNHVLSMRQPGSVFKPIVYATALETAITGGERIFTPASMLDDRPTTFYYEGRSYSPGNFHDNFMGSVSLRTALAHSLNNATVELAGQVGYDRVAAMARRFGLNSAIRPTPAIALGAYEDTPLEIAGAYTVFANGGRRVEPSTIALVRDGQGRIVYSNAASSTPVLDDRVNYLMVSMLQDVLRYGTGAAVHARGFNLPAAGKTGTSRDGWFAGFTSNLLCVVWVGFDDNRPLGLEGSRSALPIWTEFMKRASTLRPYRDVRDFEPPPGVVTVDVCGAADEDGGSACSREPFIEGTQPVAHPQEYADRDETDASGKGAAEKDTVEDAGQSAEPPEISPRPATPAPTVPKPRPAAPPPATLPTAPVPRPSKSDATSPGPAPAAGQPQIEPSPAKSAATPPVPLPAGGSSQPSAPEPQAAGPDTVPMGPKVPPAVTIPPRKQ